MFKIVDLFDLWQIIKGQIKIICTRTKTVFSKENYAPPQPTNWFRR